MDMFNRDDMAQFTADLVAGDGAASSATVTASILDWAETPRAIPAGASLVEAIDIFRAFPNARFLAVIDERGRPVGAVGEASIRDILFSPFGHALLANPGCRWTLAELIRPCPVGEVDASIERLLTTFAGTSDCEGMILTRGGVYAALLPSNALLQLAARKELAAANKARRRARTLADAIERFRGDAIGFSADLVQAAELIDSSADTLVERARLNGLEATAAAAASNQSAEGVAEVAESAQSLAGQVESIQGRIAEAKSAVEEAVGQVEIGESRNRALTAAAREIGEVVDLISSIAAKVNLLAVNATIEAARAGPAGRGFTVVAREVKLLANQVGEAAKKVGGRIASVRAAVADTDEAHRNINEIVGGLDAVASGILESAVEQSHATKLIAQNVEQAAEASAAISNHVSELSSRAATAGALAERMNEVASGLLSRADQLSKRVGAFLDEVRTS